MKTTWNHPAKKRALLWFSFFCFLLLLSIPLDLQYSELRTLGDFCFLSVFVVFACFFGYRAFFHSDDWFRAREEKWTVFRSRHPRIEIAAAVLVWAALIGYIVWHDFYKH